MSWWFCLLACLLVGTTSAEDPLLRCFEKCKTAGFATCTELTREAKLGVGSHQRFACKHACVMRNDGEPLGTCKGLCQRTALSGCFPKVQGRAYDLCQKCADNAAGRLVEGCVYGCEQFDTIEVSTTCDQPYEKTDGVHYDGNNYQVETDGNDCGRYATEEGIKLACSSTAECVGYSLCNVDNNKLCKDERILYGNVYIREKGLKPWCLKTVAIPETETTRVEEQFFRKKCQESKPECTSHADCVDGQKCFDVADEWSQWSPVTAGILAPQNCGGEGKRTLLTTKKACALSQRKAKVGKEEERTQKCDTASMLFYDSFEGTTVGTPPDGWTTRVGTEPMTVEIDPKDTNRGNVLKANSCVGQGNMFSDSTVSCTAELPCSISYYAKSAGPSTQVWQGFSNGFPGPHSWTVTPGPKDASDDNFATSYVDSKSLLQPANTWTLLQYVYPNKNDPMIHQYESGKGDHTGLRIMLEAFGDECGSVVFDDFCVCRTTHAGGIKWCCGSVGGTTTATTTTTTSTTTTTTSSPTTSDATTQKERTNTTTTTTPTPASNTTDDVAAATSDSTTISTPPTPTTTPAVPFDAKSNQDASPPANTSVNISSSSFDSNSDTSSGSRAGIVVGILLVVVAAVCGIAVCFCTHWCKRKDNEMQAAREEFQEDDARRNTVSMVINPLAERRKAALAAANAAPHTAAAAAAAAMPTAATPTVAAITVNPTFVGTSAVQLPAVAAVKRPVLRARASSSAAAADTRDEAGYLQTNHAYTQPGHTTTDIASTSTIPAEYAEAVDVRSVVVLTKDAGGYVEDNFVTGQPSSAAGSAVYAVPMALAEQPTESEAHGHPQVVDVGTVGAEASVPPLHRPAAAGDYVNMVLSSPLQDRGYGTALPPLHLHAADEYAVVNELPASMTYSVVSSDGSSTIPAEYAEVTDVRSAVVLTKDAGGYVEDNFVTSQSSSAAGSAVYAVPTALAEQPTESVVSSDGSSQIPDARPEGEAALAKKMLQKGQRSHVEITPAPSTQGSVKYTEPDPNQPAVYREAKELEAAYAQVDVQDVDV